MGSDYRAVVASSRAWVIEADGVVAGVVVNEWATGVSLDILLAAEGPLAPRRAAWIISEVAATLEVAHAAGVAHGRLVPENVLIDRTGSIRVIAPVNASKPVANTSTSQS